MKWVGVKICPEPQKEKASAPFSPAASAHGPSWRCWPSPPRRRPQASAALSTFAAHSDYALELGALDLATNATRAVYTFPPELFESGSWVQASAVVADAASRS